MAKTVTEEEIQLKKRARRRLIGAIALVILAVIFLPMVLDSEPKPVNQDIKILIPEKETAGSFTSKIVPLTETASPGLPAKADSSQKPPPPASNPQPTPGADTPRPETAHSGKDGRPATPDPQAAGAGADTFVVQFGAFASASNVKQLQQKLSANGIKSYTETLKTADGEKTRVRAGPFATREAAEKTRDRIKGLGLGGVGEAKVVRSEE